jgi:hypothetical protein
MRKSEKIGSINPNLIKSRDLVHLQELTHGSGTGPHKSKKHYNRQQSKRDSSNTDGSFLLVS